MYRILITDDLSPEGLAILKAAPDVQYDVVKRPPRQELLGRVHDYDAVIVRSSTPLDAGVFTAAPHLRVVGRAGVGLDGIDVPAATHHGTLIMNTPEANTLAAVEATLALMFALCRRVPQAYASLRAGAWERSKFLGVQLSGKVLGVIGLGRIGSRVATRCQALGMEVVAYDPYISEEVAERLRVELVAELDELLARSDVITVHMPLTEETRGMLSEAQFARMKNGVRLVNCARGAIVDEKALYRALVSGKVAGAALDVFSEEPPHSETLRALLALDTVVATPHIGASTIEAQQDASVQIVQGVLAALRGEGYPHAVNLPFANGADYQALLPYLRLAEKVGSLQMQLVRGRVGRVEVDVRGEEIATQVKAITVALLKGLLEPILKETVNYVNAPALAAERGIAVAQVHGEESEDYPNLISCRVVSTQETRLVAGSLFSRARPRIVQIDEYPMDVQPVGNVLIIASRDVPGVMGRIGTILGNHDLNIAEWRLGRTAPGEMELSFINMDSPVPDDVIREIAASGTVMDVRQVAL
ncbi:MAG: phosphoglycerate dehydrogenase [Anaerolineae bacterium]|nr:phosphoglycerate dehydrogenase [Anaerolineae bacterium]